jgi:hypothetical protein
MRRAWGIASALLVACGTSGAGSDDAGADGSTPPTTLVQTFAIQTIRLIHHALLYFDHTSANDAAKGILSGVLDPNELVPALRVAFAQMGGCGSVFDSAVEQIQQAQDILLDGSNQRGVPCDGISIGLGFDAKRVANPTKVAFVPPPRDRCP